jgi:hypothetical protein
MGAKFRMKYNGFFGGEGGYICDRRYKMVIFTV